MYLTREPISIYDVILSPSCLSVDRQLGRRISRSFAGSPRTGSASATDGNDEQTFQCGASVLFFGIVRNHTEGRKVLYLEYEAYEKMADRMIRELIDFAFRHWPVETIHVLHRLGRVDLGEIAVAIDVRSAHRDEAYQASRYLIEEIKHNVPIWKKEYFEDGTSEWSLCQSHAELSRSV